MALLLNRQDVASLLTMPETMLVVEEAFRQLALGTVTMPQRTVIRLPQHRGVHLGMPAFIGGEIEALALKVVTVYPDNPSRFKLPTTIGVLLLSDPRSGAPLAVMDAGYLTAVRTGAVSGVATKHLARRSARTLGILGAGVMARHQLAAVATARSIASVSVYDTDRARARAFADEMSHQHGVAVTPVNHAREAVVGHDIIVIATSATEPVLDGDWLEPGQHINAIGSHAPSHRELDTTAIVRSKVFPDFLDACLIEAGDIMLPLREGAITPEHLRASLGEVVAGLKPGRERDTDITLFKSVGLAIQDVATANFVYRRAIEAGAGTPFEFL